MPIKMTKENMGEIPHSIIVKMQAIYDTLKTAEKKAADLLLTEPLYFSKASIVEAAETAGCSEATFVRLARKLGYMGYPALKAAILAEENKESPALLYKSITENDDCNAVIRKVFDTSIQALRDTLNVINREKYGRAVDAVCKADKIVLCGVGDAVTVIRSGYQKFLRAGMDVQASSDIDVQLISISHMKKNDVVIAVSHSGRTKSIIEVVKYAKTMGVTVISITNYPVSQLAKNSDIVLLTATFAEHMKGEVISKRVAELCILESLYINLLLNRKQEMGFSIDRSNRALEKNKIHS